MFGLGEDAVYIVWSYVGVGVVVAAVIGSVWVDNTRQKRRLKMLETAGLRRRGSGTGE